MIRPAYPQLDSSSGLPAAYPGDGAYPPKTPPGSGDNFVFESGDNIILERGDNLILES